MKQNQNFSELSEHELTIIGAGDYSLLYWLGRLAGEVVKTQQQNPGFGDALVMAMH